MDAGVALYLATLAASVVVSLYLAVESYRNRSRVEMKLFAGLMGSLVLWSAMDLVQITTPRAVSWVARNFLYVGVVLTVLFFFLFAVTYAGYGEYVTTRTVALLSIQPVVMVAGVWTNHLHHLVLPGPYTVPNPVGDASLSLGPLFLVHLVYSYALILAGMVLLAQNYYRKQSLYRGQILALLVGTFVPLAASVSYFLEVVPVDLTPSGVVVTGISAWVAMWRFDFVDLTPVARETVVDNVRAGTFVLNDDDRFIDVNPPGREMLDVDREVIGAAVRDVFPAELYECYRRLEEGTEEVTVETEGRLRHYQVEATTLPDDHGNDVGTLLVVREVTDRIERERELRRQNEQLEQFASLVSHDLRNPLNVADGYVEQIQGEVNDPLDEYAREVQRSHERMRRIIDDVLTMARQGQTITDTEQVHLGSLAHRAWSNVDTADATLEVDLPAVVEGDPDRLLQAFENLFRNAIDHGGEAVTVRVGALDGTAVEADPAGGGFFVEDDGPGIPPETREQVSEAGHTTHTEGTGLGLAIVEQFLEAHGWSVEATESDSGGARFGVTGVPAVESGGRPTSGSETAVADGAGEDA